MTQNKRNALIGFLGTGNYTPLRYALGEQISRESRLSSRALSQFFSEHEVVIVATKEAYKANWRLVVEEFGYEPKRVPIPTGSTEKEVWKILKVLTDRFATYDRLVLDVTHGFRAQPLLAFSAAQLLHTLHHVQIDGIFYAARRMHGASDVAPIFDLAPLLHMVRWAESLSSLEKYGFAEGVSNLLDEASKVAWTRQHGPRPKKLQTLGQTLSDLSTALALNRPKEAADHVLKLRRFLPEAARELRAQPTLAPMAPLFKSSLKRLAALIPASKDNPFSAPGKPMLRSIAAMIRYNLQIGAYAQAITLSREALVTRLCLEHRLDVFDAEARHAMENQLNAWLHLRRAGSPLKPKEQSYVDLWNSVVDVRNDINHAGFKKRAGSGSRLAKRTAELAEKVADWLEH